MAFSKHTPTINIPKDELVAQIKVEAMKRYEKGWDVVIECMTDAEILEVIGGARTHWGALTKMAQHLGPQISYRREIEATAF